MTLLEQYKNRINLAESVHMKTHNGERMSAGKKLMVATVLNNTAKFLNEAFQTTAATQRNSLGDYKRFCLNVSNISLPNLIAPELMLVQPMTSIAGYVTYLKFQAGVDKGTVTKGDLFNSVYGLGAMTEGRMQYTSNVVINEKHTVNAAEVAAHSFALDWFPVLDITALEIKNTKYSVVAAGSEVADTSASVNKDTGFITFSAKDTKFETGAEVKILYSYDNVTIPQNSVPESLPTLKAHMAHIDLHAHARRIAIYYSQIANFQAKTDYNMDLGEQLAQQAQGELAYEIDSEAVHMLFEGAEPSDELKFVRYADDKAISRSQYYEAFSEIIARAKAIIYTRTQKLNMVAC